MVTKRKNVDDIVKKKVTDLLIENPSKERTAEFVNLYRPYYLKAKYKRNKEGCVSNEKINSSDTH